MRNNFNLDALVRPNVKAMEPYSSARDEFTEISDDLVYLDANENPFNTGVNRYPDPHQQKLKTILAKQRGINSSNLLLGNGSDEILDLLFRAFCEPKTDSIITVPPTYGMYKVLAGVNAVRNKEVLLTSSFQLNVAGILEAIDETTKLIFICSPNNPTGNSIASEDIPQLLASFRGLVVIDEAYIDFSKQQSWANVLDEYPNLVVTQTLSKAYAMAGIRLGICIASEAIIAVLRKIKPPYNVNTLTQERAIAELESINDIKERIHLIISEKELLSKQLLEVNFIQDVLPSDANFLLVRVDDANKRYTELTQQGIIVRNRSTQPMCDNTLRITIGTPSENKRLRTVLKNME
ncbi:histidinol-phosphate transaminase [Candidatus Ulvibacter alkanivorans]|uniref:histidinol-phosphate transaminase n=1 Tax=Candidatus Ulvibacter alkanivorans TaxID=2267620 RepID=UPI000DF20E34|nr:histidinol-phosphate transaminase [Candidatus Ulvibacter alkanivorans]